MGTVRELLATQPDEIWFVGCDTTVREALQMMAERDVGALLVVEHDKLVGVFSERDCAREVVLAGKSPETTRVGEVMSRRVMYVTPDETAQDCLSLMTDRHIRHLPVLEKDRLVGILTLGDLARWMIAKDLPKTRRMKTRVIEALGDDLSAPPE